MFVVGLTRWFSHSDSESPRTVSQCGEKAQGRDEEFAQTQQRILDDFGEESDAEIPDNILSRFKSASSFVQSVTDQIPQSALFRLYANYKLATCGKADPKDRPSMFDIKGRAKFDAWASAGDATKVSSMQEYADIVEKLNIGWNPADQSQSGQGFGLRPSRLRPQESECEPSISGEIDPISKNRVLWFVACKADDLSTAQQLLDYNNDLMETKDEHLGMTALQWAIDSGADRIVEWLIKEGADVNATDPEGNTPLHFAAYCGRESSARILIAAGADKTRANVDGLTPREAADEEVMIDLLKSD